MPDFCWILFPEYFSIEKTRQITLPGINLLINDWGRYATPDCVYGSDTQTLPKDLAEHSATDVLCEDSSLEVLFLILFQNPFQYENAFFSLRIPFFGDYRVKIVRSRFNSMWRIQWNSTKQIRWSEFDKANSTKRIQRDKFEGGELNEILSKQKCPSKKEQKSVTRGLESF